MDEQPETTQPSEARKPIICWGFILWPSVVFLLYVLSFGPVVRMRWNAPESWYFEGNRKEEFQRISYEPLWWVYERTPLHKPLGIYLHFWAPDAFNKNGDWWDLRGAIEF
jgi:hypothetical protein